MAHTKPSCSNSRLDNTFGPPLNKRTQCCSTHPSTRPSTHNTCCLGIVSCGMPNQHKNDNTTGRVALLHVRPMESKAKVASDNLAAHHTTPEPPIAIPHTHYLQVIKWEQSSRALSAQLLLQHEAKCATADSIAAHHEYPVQETHPTQTALYFLETSGQTRDTGSLTISPEEWVPLYTLPLISYPCA